jgi:4-hydroxybenzoate polyprenyltransferase
MIKFEHSIFALPFAYLGLFLAENGWPRLSLFIGVTIAMVSFRTFGMGLNRLIDVPVDSLNPRTQNRALPAGQLKPFFVWAVTLLSLVIFEISAYLLSPLCFMLSPIPVLLAWLYPWTKRFTWLSHMILGIILGIAPYGAPGALTLGVTAWVSGFDIIYALQDLDFDQRHGLFSVPAHFGSQASLAVTWLLHAVAIFAWLIAGTLANAGVIYFGGLFLVTLFLIRENWLVRSFGITKMGEAFFTMNAVVSLLLFVSALADLSFRGLLS